MILFAKKNIGSSLSLLSPVHDSFYTIYNQSKLSDLDFKPFKANGKDHALSFVLFENELEYETDHSIRREAFLSFSTQLAQYQHTMAAAYNAHIQQEKIMADTRKFDSIFDYLLFDQKVSKDMYDRQLDIIMADLAPVMRKYATLIKDVYQLDTMTFSDLKLPIDPDFEPNITVDQARETILEGLAPLGKEYSELVNQAFDNRWIDFVQNTGKSTGAFCSSPYGAHPYILISWTKRMRECFVLAHELGHAGHFYNAHQHQNILNSNASLYFIEAPSTMNELLVAQSLKDKATDLRMKRWVLATIISRTYYHNFVTHLLEAVYQKEVYKIVDNGGSVVAETLSSITLDVLKNFWGDAVKVQEEAKYTWMRQPHYYMGLYSYTYSAGLTLATQASKQIQENPSRIEQWKKALQAGGTLTPLELGKLVSVDLSTDQPLKDTIIAINEMVDEMIALTKEINSLR
jgi:oligoendopeptidase F